MVPRQKDVIPREVVVVPQGQGVIPRRPRGDGLAVTPHCYDIIPLPRGDASATYSDSQVLESHIFLIALV